MGPLRERRVRHRGEAAYRDLDACGELVPETQQLLDVRAEREQSVGERERRVRRISLARADLVVILDGPEAHMQRIPSVAPAFPVTVVFDDIAPGTYVVSAQHGGSRMSREISVQGSTLQVDFVMP